MSNDIATIDTLKAENSALRQRVAELEQYAEEEIRRLNAELEQRVAERTAELSAKLRLLQSIIDSYPAIVYAKDADGRYIWVNQHAAKFAQREPADILGKSAADLFTPELAAEFSGPDMQVFNTGEIIARENMVPHPDGIQAYFLTIFPLRNEVGEIYGVCGVSLDITERKRIEQELQRQQILLNTVVNNLPTIIYVASTEGQVLLANQHASRMFGHDGKEIAGQREEAVFPAAALAYWQAEKRELLATGRASQVEEQWTMSDGEHTFLATRFPLYDDQHNIFALGIISSDITEIRQTEYVRHNLQQQIIDAQQEALRELSTPLIPLSDQVVIMPLIGTIDSLRAQLILETMLEGVATQRAKLVIMDITGVVVVDTQVAQALLRAAQAVKLLGARVMLTGIGPPIAETLVHLGVDMSGIMTRSDLQSAINWAFRNHYFRIA